MPKFPKTLEESMLFIASRVWSVHMVDLALQLARQAGQDVQRPVPEEWLKKAFAVHNQEFVRLSNMLDDHWESMRPPVPPK